MPRSKIFDSLICLFFLLGFSAVVGGSPPGMTKDDVGSGDLANVAICILKEPDPDCIPVRLIFTIFSRAAEFLPGYEEAGLFIIAVLACFNIPALKKIILFFNKKE